ncbi:MAG: DUF5658 family protein [Gemmatimonadota bacterium]
MPQPPLSPSRRLVLWSGLLAAYSLLDLTLTAIALCGIEGARELNPVAAAAFGVGLPAALALKLLGASATLGFALALSRTPYARTTERILAVWCALFLVVNAHSALLLMGVS